VKAIKGSANSVSQGLSRKGSVGLDNSALTMCPLRFNWVEPGAFDWQEANQNANTFSCPFDSTVMCSYPGTHSSACVPTGVVPNHCQNRLVQILDFLAAPLQKLNGDAAHGSSINETQKHFLEPQIIACHPSQKEAIARQSFWVRVIFLPGLLYQSHRRSFFAPGRQVRLGKAAPPGFVLKAPNPTMLLCQRYYSVTRLFLRSYSGSGLVIQCLARFQETFKRFKACRTQSSLTWREVMPSAKLTSAANSSVQTLVSLPKSLGLRCNIAFNFSRLPSLNIGRVVFGRREPISRAATPRSLNPTMTLRSVWSSQPRNSAIRGAFSPRALDKMIWLLLTVNGLEDRKPLVRLCRSSSLSFRTKIGVLIPSTISLPRISLSGLH